MRKWAPRILVVLIAAAVLNDGARYLVARYRIEDVTRNMAFAASQQAKAQPGTNTGWPAAAKIGQGKDIVVTGYEQVGGRVRVDTAVEVPGTLVAAPLAALLARQPVSTPLTITHEAIVGQ